MKKYNEIKRSCQMVVIIELCTSNGSSQDKAMAVFKNSYWLLIISY
jgi:hypothetical protein